jgi:hypothetical protein
MPKALVLKNAAMTSQAKPRVAFSTHVPRVPPLVLTRLGKIFEIICKSLQSLFTMVLSQVDEPRCLRYLTV